MNLEIEVKNLRDRVQELETIKAPNNLMGRIDNLNYRFDELQTTLTELIVKLKSYIDEDKFLELFPDETIKEFYMRSGLTANYVQEFLKKILTGEDGEVSLATVSKYINGESNNLVVRSKLGKFLRAECAKIDRKKVKSNK